MHVLIVEDDRRVAMQIWAALEDFGIYSLAIAQTESDALEQALLVRPDLITCDVHLREGTGTAAISMIRRVFGDIPVIYIASAPSDIGPGDVVAPIISKPFTANILFETLRASGVREGVQVMGCLDAGWRTCVGASH